MQLQIKLTILLLSVIVCGLFSQEYNAVSKITLKSGSVFVGELILKNDELVMLKDNTGARFQFALPEIEKIETVSTDKNVAELANNTATHSDSFRGQIELTVGNASGRKLFDTTPATQLGLTFGRKKVFGKDVYVGVGAGFLWISDANLGLIPATLKIQTYTSKNRTSPLVGFESGYAFSVTNNYGGGPFAKILLGVNHRLNYKSAIYVGVSAAVYSISGRLSESTQNGIFNFEGTTSINALGLNLGFQF